MLIDIESAKNIITKDVFDSYGRKLGRVISFVTDSSKNVPSLGVELSNGNFEYYPSSQISIDDDGLVTIYSSWLIESESLKDEYMKVLQKNSALSKLQDKGDIPSEVYDDIGKQYDSTLKALTTRCKILAESLEERSKAVSSQICELKTSLVHVKIEYMVQNIDEKSYDSSCLSLNNMLNRASQEKKDLEATLSSLPNEFTLNVPKDPASSLAQDLPMVTSQTQPILLRIKEAES